jgi:hypothetical protein
MNRFTVTGFSYVHHLVWMLVCVLMAASFALPSSAQTSTFRIQKSPSRNAQGNTLNAVAALSKSDAWAVGFQNDNNINESRTLTLHWDGVSWRDIRSPNPGSPASCGDSNTGNDLTSIATVSANDVWAAGFSFTCTNFNLVPMTIHWDGQRWKVVRTPALGTNGNSSLNGLVALAPDNIYAVGYQSASNGAVLTLIEHWDGKKWTVVPSPNRSPTGNLLSAVSANSRTDIWAVGVSVDQPTTSVQTLVEHFDGMRWRVVPSPNPLPKAFLNQNVLSSVRTVSANDVTAVGLLRDAGQQRELTLVERWNGKKWSVIPSPNQSDVPGSLNTLTSVTAVSATDIYAVGFFGDAATSGQDETLVEHFNGKKWSIVASPTKGLAQQLNGAFALPGTADVWTVGAYSDPGIDFETGFLQLPKTLVLFSTNGQR